MLVEHEFFLELFGEVVEEGGGVVVEFVLYVLFEGLRHVLDFVFVFYAYNPLFEQ